MRSAGAGGGDRTRDVQLRGTEVDLVPGTGGLPREKSPVVQDLEEPFVPPTREIFTDGLEPGFDPNPQRQTLAYSGNGNRGTRQREVKELLIVRKKELLFGIEPRDDGRIRDPTQPEQNYVLYFPPVIA